MQKLSVSVLGATGTVGRASLEVCEQAGFRVVALCAANDIDGLVELCARHRPDFAALANPQHHDALRQRLHASGVRSGAGEQAVLDAARLPNDATVAAISGVSGLLPTMAAAECKTKLVLANKECIVAGGAWFLQHCVGYQSPIVPADSEHNAIFQILEGQKKREALDKIILTASGGPFLNQPVDTLSTITTHEACAHPNFHMGAKIAVDSATMMNKALEVIEASWLFDIDEKHIDIAVHPQQVVHGMVAYRDGSTFAHLGACDMRAPLWHALHWPQRVISNANAPQQFDWRKIDNLSFSEIDSIRFPAPALARASLINGVAPIILNAANEVLVKSFLSQNITFDKIVPLLQHIMQKYEQETLDPPNSLERILTIDAYGRRLANECLMKNSVSKHVVTILPQESKRKKSIIQHSYNI